LGSTYTKEGGCFEIVSEPEDFGDFFEVKPDIYLKVFSPEARHCAEPEDDMYYMWDVFISHASEDKATVAVPLARLLEGAGLRVWLDEQELRIGDSLRAKIDDGLARSRFGVVVISPRFLEKRWTANELDGFFATESATQIRLLPIWHEITAVEVARNSPLLAARVAARTSSGLDTVARSIAQVVVSTVDSPAVATPSLCRRLLRVIEEDGSPDAIVNFLSIYPEIVRTAVGAIGYEDQILWRVEGGGHAIDCAINRFQGTTGRFDWIFLRFASPQTAPVSSAGAREFEVLHAVQELVEFRCWTASNLPAARNLIRGLEVDSLAVAVAGRRERLTTGQLSALAEWNAELIGTRIRTYDWLVEGCTQIDVTERRKR
jgi:hypothetical protein